MSMDAGVEHFVETWRRQYGLSRQQFIERILLDYIAHLSAWTIALPDGPRPRLVAFTKHEGKLLQGRELFQFAEGVYIREISSAAEKAAPNRAWGKVGEPRAKPKPRARKATRRA